MIKYGWIQASFLHSSRFLRKGNQYIGGCSYIFHGRVFDKDEDGEDSCWDNDLCYLETIKEKIVTVEPFVKGRSRK